MTAGLMAAVSASSAQAMGAGTPGPATGGTPAPAPAYWDGDIVPAGGEIKGLRDVAAESIDRWRRFATLRGYRLDLDETQRILTLSDAERFEVFSKSRVVIDRTVRALAPYIGAQDAPVVVLRASDEDDARTARVAADALGFGLRVFTMVETGSRQDRRAVDARLAESVVRAELALHAPHLSAWMVDGLASVIAEEVTGRTLIDGDVTTMRRIRREVAKRRRDIPRVDILEISGARPGEPTRPMQAEAACVVARLIDESEVAFATTISTLGSAHAEGGEARSTLEERVIKRHFGMDALDRVGDALRRGR